MYSLFIDTLSSPSFICLFDKNKDVIDSISWEGRHAEFDTLIESIDFLINKYDILYSQIQNIACIIWPWGFTGIRVTTLVANTLSYSFWIPLYPITVNDFFHYQESPLPWILPLTKTEVILWETSDVHSFIVKTVHLNTATIYATNQILSPENAIQSFIAHNYQLFLRNFPFSRTVWMLQPIYARDPNILVKK